MANEPVLDPRGNAELLPAPIPESTVQLGAGAAPRPAPGGGGAGGNVMARYFAALRRYKWLIMAVALAGIAATAGATRFMHPKYVAEATIWVEVPGKFGDQASGPVQPGELLVSTGWLDLLQSFTVMDAVVRTERMYLDYAPQDAAVFTDFHVAPRFHAGEYTLRVSPTGRAYTLISAEGAWTEQGTPGDSIGRKVGFMWAPPARALRAGREIRFTLSAPRDAAKKLNDGLNAAMPKNGNFIRLSLSGEDPPRIASEVNAVADRFVSAAAEIKAAKMTEVARILGNQVQVAEGNLRDAEGALQDFNIQNATKPSGALVPVDPGTDRQQRSNNTVSTATDGAISNYFNTKIMREQLLRDGEAIQRALTAGPDGGPAVDALAVIGAVQQSPEMKAALEELTRQRAQLQALRLQFTDDYSAVKKQKADIAVLEHQTLPRVAAALLSALQLRGAVMDTVMAGAGGELRAIPPRVIEQARLQRRVTVAEELYNNIQRRYEEARLAAATAIPDIRVLDRATVPREPDNDPRIKVVLLGVIGSLGLAVLLAFMLDRFDRHVRYPEEVTFHMGLPILGVLPQIRLQGGAVESEELSQILESLRTIRLNVLHAYGSAGPIMLTVSSPGSGEGKSFVVSNLALAFADQGFRTLVIDGDIRRGTIHHLLKLERKPGLTDFLDGTATEGDVIRRTSHERLDCLTSGTRMRNGPELLGSAAMRQLVLRLRSLYDIVLIDSPPLAAGVDPFVLATVAGHLLLVMRTGRTERAVAHAHLENLTRVSTRVLGVVLNGISEHSVYRYYRYLPGYDSGPEDEIKQLQPAG